MNDPHVKALHYRVIVGENVDYNNVPPVSESTDEFELSIDGKTAIFEIKKHYSTVDEAKAIVNEYLRAWDILIGLEHDPDDLRLVFDHADIIDRLPQKTEENVVNLQAHVSGHVTVSGNVTLHVSRRRYPSFPKNFIASLDAETTYLRYKAYRQNREKLTSMAYMCLTILEASAGDRKKVAKQYCVDYSVLDTLGKLCSTKGDSTEARKFPRNGIFTPLSQKEKEWIVSVIRMLIRREGEYAHSPRAKFKQLTVKDFPSITT